MGKKRKNSNYVTEKKIKAREEAIKAQKVYRTKKITISVIAIVLAITCLVFGIILIANSIPKYVDNGETVDKTVTHHASIVIKDYGTLHVELYGNEAPETVDNFVKLANDGFYNGLTFHRVMKDFMIQGGDPKGNGTGNSENKINGEFTANGFNNGLKHERGTISMARGGNDMNSASCQFFIVHQTSANNTLSLDGKYAAFGKVTSGMEFVDKIVQDMVDKGYNELVNSKDQPIIESISIHASH